MGEAKRRRQATRFEKRQHDNCLADGINAMRRASGGVMAVGVYRFSDLPGLVMRARHGNEHERALELIDAMLERHYANRGGPMAVQCICCGAEVDVPIAVAIVTGHVPDPREAVAGLVCPQCDGTHEEMGGRIVAGWRETIDPTARPIDIHPQAGRA